MNLKKMSTASKFISPFIEGEDTQVLNSSSSFTLPSIEDSLNDSLPETTTEPGLDDSLGADDYTQLPAEQAALSPGPMSESSSGPNSAATETVDNKDSRPPALNDSLVDDDETQLPEDYVAADNDQTCLATPPRPPGHEATQPTKPEAKPGEDEVLPEENALQPSRDEVISSSAAIVGPSDENPSTAPVQTDAKTDKETVSSKRIEHKKVRPSFGKKKKSFVPPTSKSVSPQSSPDENPGEEPQPATTDSGSETAVKKATVSKSKPKLQECTNKGTDLTETKTKSAPKKTSVKKPTQMNKGQKSISADKENTPPLEQSLKAPKSNTISTKPVDSTKAAAKEEREKKRLEREKAKLDKEEAKREKERLKIEKQLEQETKKAEREQKKMEKELKKMEKLQASVAKTKLISHPPKSPDTSNHPPIENDDPQNEAAIDVPTDSTCTPLLTSTIEQSPDDTSKPDTQEAADKNDAKVLPVATKADDNVVPKDDATEKNDIKTCKETENCTKTIDATQISVKPKKRKQVCENNKAAKKFKPDFSAASKPSQSAAIVRKPKKSKQAKADISKPANYSGPVWVQCDDCNKWRRLTTITDPSLVPDHWTCLMNEDSGHAQCDTPEEVWSDLGESQEFVESPFIPGSLVWAKMDGYPWWPAMVEEDPNEEAYYEMGRPSNLVPVRYHVVFLDTPVCRAWVHCQSIQTFYHSADPNQHNRVNVSKKYHRSLKMATKQASKALNSSFKERLERLSFSQRFRKGTRKRKAALIEEDCMDNQEVVVQTTTKSGKRKSAMDKDQSTTPTPPEPVGPTTPTPPDPVGPTTPTPPDPVGPTTPTPPDPVGPTTPTPPDPVGPTTPTPPDPVGPTTPTPPDPVGPTTPTPPEPVGPTTPTPPDPVGPTTDDDDMEVSSEQDKDTSYELEGKMDTNKASKAKQYMAEE